MMRKILLNSSWLLLANSLIKIISFFYTLFLAKTLGVSNFGLFVVALAYFSLVASLVDFGFNRYIVREGAKNTKILPSLLGTIILIRIILVVTVIVFFGLFIYSFDKNLLRADLALLATVAVLPQSIAITLDACLVALEKLRYSAYGLVVLTISSTFLGVYLIFSGSGVYGPVIALVVGNILYLAFLIPIVRINKIDIFSKVSLSGIGKILSGSLPYGFLGILGLLYFRVDVLLLSYIKNSAETGIYGAAYKFLEAVVFVPSAISAGLFPQFAKLADKNPCALYALYKKSLVVAFLISLPFVLGFIFILPIIIKMFLPQYFASIELVKILALTIPFLFMISPQSLIFFSQGKLLKSLLVISIFNLLLNVLLNVWLIPFYSYYASAWITIFSDILGFLIFFFFIKYFFQKRLI